LVAKKKLKPRARIISPPNISDKADFFIGKD